MKKLNYKKIIKDIVWALTAGVLLVFTLLGASITILVNIPYETIAICSILGAGLFYAILTTGYHTDKSDVTKKEGSSNTCQM